MQLLFVIEIVLAGMDLFSLRVVVLPIDLLGRSRHLIHVRFDARGDFLTLRLIISLETFIAVPSFELGTFTPSQPFLKFLVIDCGAESCHPLTVQICLLLLLHLIF